MAEPVSLSKLLLQTRGQEVVRGVKVANLFKTAENNPLAVKIVPRPKGGEEMDEEEFLFKGTETLTTTTWNINTKLKWDGCELADETHLGPLLNAGAPLPSHAIRSRSDS